MTNRLWVMWRKDGAPRSLYHHRSEIPGQFLCGKVAPQFDSFGVVEYHEIASIEPKRGDWRQPLHCYLCARKARD